VDTVERGQDANGIGNAATEQSCESLIPLVQGQTCNEFIDLLNSTIPTARKPASGDIDGFDVGKAIAESVEAGL
jgi:hypothetical protein